MLLLDVYDKNMEAINLKTLSLASAPSSLLLFATGPTAEARSDATDNATPSWCHPTIN